MSHYDEQEDEYIKSVKAMVKQPQHYQVFPGSEAIEIIAASLTPIEFRGYCLGNSLKYRLRAGKKGDLATDIAKAEQYVQLFNQFKK